MIVEDTAEAHTDDMTEELGGDDCRKATCLEPCHKKEDDASVVFGVGGCGAWANDRCEKRTWAVRL